VLGADNKLGRLLKLTAMLERYELDEAMPLLKEFHLTLADAAEIRMNSFILKDRELK
jgi:hypothetical protein